MLGPHILPFKHKCLLSCFCNSNEMCFAYHLLIAWFHPWSGHSKVQRVKVRSEKLTPQWQVSDCYKTRSSLLPSRGGINLCFSQLFSETERQQILPAQSAAIRMAIPSLTARDQGRKHLRQWWCNEQSGRKTQLVSWMQPHANWTLQQSILQSECHI